MQNDPVNEAQPSPLSEIAMTSRRSSRQRIVILGTLFLILAIGAFFRFNGRDFDQLTYQHPDEITVSNRLARVHWPGPGENFFDARTSPMNLRSQGMEDGCPAAPCEYPYGSLPIYMAKGLGWLVDAITPASDPKKGFYINNPAGLTTVGRNLSTMFDLFTVFLVFLIGRRLYSSRTGLIAAALVAFSVTNIQLAHFSTVDSILTTFMIAALYFSVLMMQRPSIWAALAAGLSVGFAVATKVSVVPFALVILVAILLRSLYRKQTRKLGAEFGAPVGLRPASAAERSRSFWSHFGRGLIFLPIAGIGALLGFVIGEPYVLWQFNYSLLSQGGIQAVLKSNPWWTRIVYEAGIQSGQSDIVYTRQYVGTVPILYHLQNMAFWGLSPIPGIVTVIGFVVGIWKAFWRRPAELLLLSAALPYFASLLTLEAKWMRYMLPLVPIFCILGASFLVRSHIWVQSRIALPRRVDSTGRARTSLLPVLQRNIFAILTGASILAAFLWAVAFANIYSQPHSRIQASAWIRDNVPPGITKTSEGWDGTLPLGGADCSNCRDESLDIYGDQPPDQKFEYFKSELSKVDYIFIASNRLYGSVAREPWRYPVHIKFYDLLYAGKLGFQLVHTDHITPEIFGIQFDDQSADESFTVYDHPRVDIFKKTNTLTDDQLRTLFQPALDRPTGDFSTTRHGTITDDKPLTYREPISSLPDVGDYAWNPLAQESTQWIAVLLWLLAAQLLGFLALPIIFTVCRNLPDRGYAFAKILGLLIVSWAAWVFASVRMIPFTVWSILFAVVLLAGLSALCWRLGAGKQIREFFATKARLVIFYELVFFIAFAAFLYLRVMNPDLWQPTVGGEKPMEIGFLNSVLRSPWMPPLDPFFSGGYVNYYYHGYVMVATLIKLVGVNSAIGFNLAIPILYALTFTAGASVVYNIVAWSQKRRGSTHEVSRAGMAFGILAGVLMLAIGNMNGLWQFIMVNMPQWRTGMSTWARSAGFTEASMTGIYASYNFWDPRSIIPGTINEFPYWTYLFADLHPHLIDMAFTIFTAGLSLNLALSGAIRRTVLGHIPNSDTSFRQTTWPYLKNALGWLWGDGWAGALRFAVMALALGVLAVTNSWDFPTYAGLAFAGVLVALFCAKPLPMESLASPTPLVAENTAVAAPTTRDIWTTLFISLVSVGVLAGAALLAFLPFFLGFKAFFTQILPNIDGALLPAGGTIMRRTTLGEFLVFWFIFVFIALSFLVYRLLKFPWSRSLKEWGTILGLAPRAQTAASMTPQSAFQLESANSEGKLRPRLFSAPRPMTLATAGSSAGAGEQFTVPTTYSFRTEVNPNQEESAPALGTDSNPLPGVELEHEHAPDVYADLKRNGEGFSGSEPIVDGPYGDSEALAGEDAHSIPGTIEVPPTPGTWLSHNTNGIYADMDVPQEHIDELRPLPADDWKLESLPEPALAPVQEAPLPMEGAIPAWAGLLLLGVTGALVLLQLVTKQNLLALLALLLGGIISTTLASRRSVSSYFTSLLLVIGLGVAMAVELIYLADHLKDGDTYRMNTVFKFYNQVWVLLAMGGAAAIYFILFGLRESRRTAQDAQPQSENLTASQALDGVYVNGNRRGVDVPTDTHVASSPVEVFHAEQADEDALTTHNWLIWAGTGPLGDEDLPPDVTSVVTEEPITYAAPLVAAPIVEVPERLRYKPRWSAGMLAWTALFAIILLGSLTYTIVETPVRVNTRFDVSPPIGTLNGQKYMTTATLNNPDAAPFPMQLKYDYDAIQWMNENIKGEHVVAERPLEYYRGYGQRMASNTGFPTLVGPEHAGEQRYGWQVGPRNGDADDFFKTTDVQRALILISKYDIDYIYLGQEEQGYAPAGVAKFKQMADPKVGILRQVFRTPADPDIPGTTIYQVIRDTNTITGSPVEGSGIQGISLTPVPTAIPTPAPTPPTSDPTLKALLDDSRANPQDTTKRGNLAAWYRENGYHEYAAKEFEAITKLDPNNVALRHQWGDELQQAGKPAEALAAWASAVDVAPNDPAAHNKLGIAYFDRRQYDKAKEQFEATVHLDEKWTEGWFHLGESYERLGKRDDAKNAYQSAISKSEHPDTDGWAKSSQDRLNAIK